MLIFRSVRERFYWMGHSMAMIFFAKNVRLRVPLLAATRHSQEIRPQNYVKDYDCHDKGAILVFHGTKCSLAMAHLFLRFSV